MVKLLDSPPLSFDQSLFSEFYPFYSFLQLFFDFISRTLILRSNSNLQILQLKFLSDPEILLLKFYIDLYICHAGDHNLNYLHLTFTSKCICQFNNSQNNMVYDFPFASLRSSSVKPLLLSRFNLTLHMTVMSMQFKAMKSFLEQVYLANEMILNLITGCANLEYLVIMHCYGMKDVRISSLKLKNLGLWKFHCDEGSVEISSPNLSKIGFYFFEVGRNVFEGSSALVEADVCFIPKAVNYGYCSKATRFLGKVECLFIQNWGCKVVAAKDLFSGNFYFYNNLNHLELQTDCSRSDLLGMATLFERSPNMETVILDRNLNLDEEPAKSQETRVQLLLGCGGRFMFPEACPQERSDLRKDCTVCYTAGWGRGSSRSSVKKRDKDFMSPNKEKKIEAALTRRIEQPYSAQTQQLFFFSSVNNTDHENVKDGKRFLFICSKERTETKRREQPDYFKGLDRKKEKRRQRRRSHLI